MADQLQHVCVLGLQWGDEGKGKIVDVLTEGMDGVVRYQGGANAGHTIWVGDVKHVLHHLPSGILREGKLAILGNGMVIEGESLLEELDKLPESALDRLYVSERAHLVLPYHRSRDRAREEASSDGQKIGTTLRGIGPTYEDKYARRGVRMADLFRPGYLEGGLESWLKEAGHSADDVQASVAVCRQLVERVGSRVCATDRVLREQDRDGKMLLFEGAQGSLLDIDFGTYPFVTSSSPSFLGLGPGSGFSPRRIQHVLGITKVYCTRVGEGPFPSELHGAEAEPLRTAGGEFGATTGRPRRCGWLDIPALRFAVELNDVDSLVLTKCDILSGRDTVPVAVAYRRGDRQHDEFPVCADDLRDSEPVYEEWPGWSEATLEAMRPFISRVEEAVGVPVSIVSTGPRRDEVVLLDPWPALVEARN